MKYRHALFAWLLIITVVALPWVLLHVNRPSSGDIERKKVIKAGSLTTKSNSVLDIYIMMGNIFRPREARSDMGFDLVAISLYFDPISIDGRTAIVGNPTLNSAIYESRKSKKEIAYLFQGVLEALDESREVVRCFLENKGTKACEGDQIVPYVWATLPGSRISDHRVKYISVLPLFDPTILIEKTPPSISRERLAENIQAAVRRLLTYAMEDMGITVRSLALPALGSTSHTGDSPYFLEFEDGFLAIVKALEQSRPPASLDRVYLVGFDQHRGQFRHDILRALLVVWDYMAIQQLSQAGPAFLAGGLVTILYVGIGTLLHRNVRQIIRDSNRWRFFRTILGISAALSGATFGTFVATASLSPNVSVRLSLYLYSVTAIISCIILAWLSKRLP